MYGACGVSLVVRVYRGCLTSPCPYVKTPDAPSNAYSPSDLAVFWANIDYSPIL